MADMHVPRGSSRFWDATDQQTTIRMLLGLTELARIIASSWQDSQHTPEIRAGSDTCRVVLL
jgi:hypothetical protein